MIVRPVRKLTLPRKVYTFHDARKMYIRGKIRGNCKGASMMEQGKMIDQIVNFVGENRESQATVAVCRRILGHYPEEMDGRTLAKLRQGLEGAGQDEIESCYYIVM